MVPFGSYCCIRMFVQHAGNHFNMHAAGNCRFVYSHLLPEMVDAFPFGSLLHFTPQLRISVFYDGITGYGFT